MVRDLDPWSRRFSGRHKANPASVRTWARQAGSRRATGDRHCLTRRARDGGGRCCGATRWRGDQHVGPGARLGRPEGFEDPFEEGDPFGDDRPQHGDLALVGQRGAGGQSTSPNSSARLAASTSVWRWAASPAWCWASPRAARRAACRAGSSIWLGEGRPGPAGWRVPVGQGGGGAAGGLLGVVERAVGSLAVAPTGGVAASQWRARSAACSPRRRPPGGEGGAGGPVDLHAPRGGQAVLDRVADQGVDEARRAGRASSLGDEPGTVAGSRAPSTETMAGPPPRPAQPDRSGRPELRRERGSRRFRRGDGRGDGRSRSARCRERRSRRRPREPTTSRSGAAAPRSRRGGGAPRREMGSWPSRRAGPGELLALGVEVVADPGLHVGGHAGPVEPTEAHPVDIGLAEEVATASANAGVTSRGFSRS